ncbi:uncharacterized protein LOC115023582 [Cottoperca gobio]|uniref:Uncharacterized protein LOC115023582 n=1 Tax=Cottoperca gobio TaxID=56716 RepID=A0A6J2RM13_COTGO|nr:uncharacterized protein LOC115023582 [Cottoperca gobio]
MVCCSCQTVSQSLTLRANNLSRLKMLLLLSCWIIAGITTEVPPMRHYRVKNSSLCLPVVTSPPYQQDTWSFNKNVIVLDKNITPNYKDKVYYNPGNQSLCIKKITETDRGIYTFTFIHLINSTFQTSTETHRLIVEETVPRPVIRLSRLHSNLSAEFCNIAVNCSIRDDWVRSVCDNNCITSQRSLFWKFNIIILTDGRSVVCIGSNHVSTTNVSVSIEAMCFGKSNHPPTVIFIVIVVCVALCAFAFCVAMGFFSTQYCHNQTSTAQMIQSQPAEAQPNSVPRVSTSSSSQAEASYENVAAPQPCQTSSPTVSPREESEQSQKVDTFYSVLHTPKVTSSQGESGDTKGHTDIQEAPTSQYVTLDETEHPAQIDTVYSVLQKPKKI